MYLLYADESGDPGLATTSPTKHFILSGLVVHESCWNDCHRALFAMRRHIKTKYGIKLNEEIHTTKMFSSYNNNSITSLSIDKQVDVLKIILKTISNTPGFNAYSVVFDKSSYIGQQNTAFDNTWKTFIQRFENTVANGNFTGPKNQNEFGMIFVDNTHVQLIHLLNQMRNYNPIPKLSGKIVPAPIKTVVGNIHMVDSKHSYFIQTADVLAYMTKQFLLPNKTFKKKSRFKAYHILQNSLCTAIGTNGIKFIP